MNVNPGAKKRHRRLPWSGAARWAIGWLRLGRGAPIFVTNTHDQANAGAAKDQRRFRPPGRLRPYCPRPPQASLPSIFGQTAGEDRIATCRRSSAVWRAKGRAVSDLACRLLGRLLPVGMILLANGGDVMDKTEYQVKDSMDQVLYEGTDPAEAVKIGLAPTRDGRRIYRQHGGTMARWCDRSNTWLPTPEPVPKIQIPAGFLDD